MPPVMKLYAMNVMRLLHAGAAAAPLSVQQSQAPAALNASYLAKELPAMRTTKTSSACLIKHSGKAGEEHGMLCSKVQTAPAHPGLCAAAAALAAGNHKLHTRIHMQLCH
jgi:hypothetical protein